MWIRNRIWYFQRVGSGFASQHFLKSEVIESIDNGSLRVGSGFGQCWPCSATLLAVLNIRKIFRILILGSVLLTATKMIRIRSIHWILCIMILTQNIDLNTLKLTLYSALTRVRPRRSKFVGLEQNYPDTGYPLQFHALKFGVNMPYWSWIVQLPDIRSNSSQNSSSTNELFPRGYSDLLIRWILDGPDSPTTSIRFNSSYNPSANEFSP